MTSGQQNCATAEVALRKIEPTTPGETTKRIVEAFDQMNSQGEQRAFVAAMAARMAMRMCGIT